MGFRRDPNSKTRLKNHTIGNSLVPKDTRTPRFLRRITTFSPYVSMLQTSQSS